VFASQFLFLFVNNGYEGRWPYGKTSSGKKGLLVFFLPPNVLLNALDGLFIRVTGDGHTKANDFYY